MWGLRSRPALVFFLLLETALAATPEAISGEMWTVSIRHLPLAAKERVVGFQANVTAGRIVSVPSVPIGWDVRIENDPSWKTRITGSVIVGAAALGAEFFTEFLVLEKYEFMDLRFGVEATIVVTEDFTIERRIHVRMKDLVLRKK